MPAVESILHLQAEHRLREVLILHTDDPEQSVRPAQTLVALCKNLAIPCQTVPVDMHDRLVAELAKLDASWIINATGGTKLMAFRIYDRAKEMALPIVYREIQEGWYRIAWDEGKASVSPWTIPDHLHHHLSLRDWIALAMMVEPENVEATAIQECEAVEPAAIQSALNRLCWNWALALKEVDEGCNSASGHGMAFERYVAQALRSQTQQVAVNLKLRNPVKGIVLLESDVVCRIGARLFLFDCKLDNSGLRSAGGDAVVQQIEQAHSRVQSLGGLAARCVLLRPTWHGGTIGQFRDYAARLNVEIWAYEDMANLFTRISHLFGSDVNGALAAAQEALDRAPQPLFGVKSEHAYATESSRRSLVFNLVEYFARSVREIGFGMLWHDEFELGTVDKASLAAPQGQERLVKALEARGYKVDLRPKRIHFERNFRAVSKRYAEETAQIIRQHLAGGPQNCGDIERHVKTRTIETAETAPSVEREDGQPLE